MSLATYRVRNALQQASILVSIALGACATTTPVVAYPDAHNSARTEPRVDVPATPNVVLSSEVEWEHLNPARGDAGPRAATLFGDRNGAEATGFLVRFVDGFSSPPHIHNVSYRGVVIRGLVHNDDPNADPMWMPTGSFWTQPVGGAHITSAQVTAEGADIVAYIEIDEGPYLVRPVDQAVDNEERPVNVDVSNLVWIPATSLGGAEDGRVAFLWGEPSGSGPYGVMLKLAPNAEATLRGAYRAVVIQGSLSLPSDTRALDPSSSFSSTGGGSEVSCPGTDTCLLYVRAERSFSLASARPNDGR